MLPKVISAAAILFILGYIYQWGGLFLLFHNYIISEAGCLMYFPSMKGSVRGVHVSEGGLENLIYNFMWPKVSFTYLNLPDIDRCSI